MPLSRRDFLKTGAALSAGAALAPGRLVAGAARPAPGAIRLGVASYSFRNFPRAKAIAMTKALGTPFINIKSVHLPYELSPADLAAGRAEFVSAGLTIVGGGMITFAKDTDEEVRKYFDYARAAGMPLIVATCPPEALPRIDRFARQYHIKVAIHNHGPEDHVFPSPYDVLRAVKDCSPRIGLCLDVGHAYRAGADVVQAIADAGPRLLDMHMKDLRDLKVKESQCIVGEGAVPIPEIFRQLQAIGYGGYVNLEYEIDPDDPLPGMIKSFEYMRGVLARMAARSG
jgi:sugar phosphate isomerase/epimerase